MSRALGDAATSGGGPSRPRAAALWAGLFLKLSARELQIAVLFIVFPALLAFIYSSAYGTGLRSLSLRAVVVSGANDGGRASILASSLRAATYEGAQAVTVYESADLEASMRALRDGAVDAVVDASGVAPASGGADVRQAEARVYTDAAAGMGPYAESYVRAAAAAAFGPAVVEPALRTAAAFTKGSGGSNDFLVSVPGLFVFGWVFGAMTTALLVVREVRRRTIDRAALAGGRASEMAAGLWAAQAVLGLLQAAALLAVLPLCGFPSPSRPLDALLAILILDVPMSALATACGLATAALCSSEGVAVNLCMIFIVPLAFLSGAVFPLPVPTLFSIGGFSVAATDFLPSAPATRALELALVRGSGLSAAAPAVLAASVGAAAWAVGGAALFGRARLSSARRSSWVRR
jgi:hypothetical protein